MRLSRYVFHVLILSALVVFLVTPPLSASVNLVAVHLQVNSIADTDDGSCNDPPGTGSGNKDCTLREAINAANLNAPSADTITFGLSGSILLGATLPALNDDLTIDGRGQTIIINGNNAVRVIEVNEGKVVTIKALTIASGNCVACDGGGIYNDGGTLNVHNSIFSANAASGDGGGGGIFSNGGTVNITDTIFEDNIVTNDGGGIYPYGATLNVTRSDFHANIAGRSGGAIHTFGTLNISESNLWVMLHRARLRLRECLQDFWELLPEQFRLEGGSRA